MVYIVEWLDDDDMSLGQIGAFFSEETAQACIAQLEAEGRTDLAINMIAVHSRLQDWEWNP
ncbi:hypothetical protein [Kribbella sp. CA-293567]|uniref:hypothetical protein n=1 Tax=Kribbella sp. CA-293567 TaxID=3002436 RepID=UPI0022DE6B8E|nr:hypothetical protein [Kribbella sp. CA-293567]WBQ05973.1 hypothetical protein OX958_04025 [Kribbella sp. CA-293567]